MTALKKQFAATWVLALGASALFLIGLNTEANLAETALQMEKMTTHDTAVAIAATTDEDATRARSWGPISARVAAEMRARAGSTSAKYWAPLAVSVTLGPWRSNRAMCRKSSRRRS